MNYYVNGYNTTGIVPYSSIDDGAPNLHTLTTNVNLNDGDIIYVRGDVDDSANELIFLANVKLYTYQDDDTASIKLIDTGIGLELYGADSLIQGLIFYKDVSSNTMVKVHNDSIRIIDCDFYHNTAGSSGICIYVMESNEVKIVNCRFIVKGNTSYHYAIYLQDSDYTLIKSNKIFEMPSNSNAIFLYGSCNYNTISYNHIGDLSVSENHGISIDSGGSYNLIMFNVIFVSGDKSNAVTIRTYTTTGKDTIISNNVFIIVEDDINCSCINIPYAGSGQTSYFTITNNSFIYYTTLSNRSITTNDSVAILASIENGVIDYNNFYGFTEYNRLITNGAPNTISQLGPKTIFEKPDLLVGTFSPEYPISAFSSYQVSANSPLIGAGRNQHNIGVGYNNRYDYTDIISMLDTVTYQFGNIDGRSNRDLVSFFGDVFTESPDEMNGIYRYSTSAYPQVDVYKNQFDWEFSSVEGWPFTQNNRLYNASFVDVLRYKGDLSPFDYISCPANPGYGFSAYDCYNTGMWGYPRASYRNNCLPDPCIIQDSYTENMRIVDTIEDVQFWIYDMVNPPCADNI